MSDVAWIVSSAAVVIAAVVAVALWLPGRLAPALRAVLAERLDGVERGQERLDRVLRDELGRSREELSRSREAAATGAHQLRQEVQVTLEGLRKTRGRAAREAPAGERREARADARRRWTRSCRARSRSGSASRSSWCSERLEQVHAGLGEMQTLATGVGDLKKVLTNVKIRGTWGEVQLGSLLEQMLTPDQYARERGDQARRASGSSSPSGCRGAARTRREVLAPHRRQVPRRGLPAAGRGLGARRRARRSRRPAQRARGADQGLRRGHPRQVPEPARTPPTSASCSCPPRGSTPR